MRQQLLAILVSFSVFFSTILVADELKLKADAPVLYQVKVGDTLWDIAGLYLQHPWLWPRLWKLNPQVDNPHLIYPGDELHLQFDARHGLSGGDAHRHMIGNHAEFALEIEHADRPAGLDTFEKLAEPLLVRLRDPILRSLREHGIEIPYPQRVLHLKPSP